jgi:nucleoid-associated protein YgaU
MMEMHGRSKAWLFGVSTALAVAAVAFLAWQVIDQNPRLFAGSAPSTPISNPPSADPPPANPPSANPPAQASTSPQEAQAPRAPARPDVRPSFDIVRVEPGGDAVIAGRASPGAVVRLRNKGVVIGEAKADENGHFALVPRALGTGEHLLTLDVEGSAAGMQGQSVTIVVPAERSAEVVVALSEPGVATRILSDRPAAPSAPSAALRIRSAEADEMGGFYATGTAAPGATVRLSLNGVAVATVEADKEGRWSLKVERGMKSGAYLVRADQIDAAGKILAQAEVPFDYPERPAPPQVAAPAPAPAKPGDAAHAVVPEVRSVTVQRGDSLWRISQRLLGSGYRYTQIYAANNNQIRNPSLIYPNQILVLPEGVQPQP